MAANLIKTTSNTSGNPPQSINCRFGERCENKNTCKFLHPTFPRTPNYNNKMKPQMTQERASSKKDTVCAWYLTGRCREGDNCPYQHPLPTPELEDILSYQSSSSIKPNVEDGMYYRTPNLNLPGIPELPPNGKCRIINDQSLVIYFIPFFQPIDGIVYFKKIRLFRFNKQSNEYKLVFSYTKQGFHITTAAASNGYLVCSRLPYDPAILKMMAEAKNLKKQNQKLQKKDEIQKNQIDKLKNQNQNLQKKDEIQKKKINKLNNQNQNLQKKGERFTVEYRRTVTYENRRLEQLQSTIMDNFRTADPIDLFVFDPNDKDQPYKHVLEYHKPADHVDLNGRYLGLWDKKTNKYHTFHIQILTENVKKYDFKKPVEPNQLCDVF